MDTAKKTRHQILIADDSEMNRAILSEILEEDYDITEVENGQQAVQTLQERASDFSLVLLDIVMPVLDGFGVLQMMQKHQLIEDVPVIMISAESSPASIDRAYSYGVADYISRPFDPAVVSRRVNNTILLYAKQRRLAEMVAEQIHEKQQSNRVMISILSHVVEFRNSESKMHVTHIGALTELLLHRLVQKTDAYHLSEEDIALISMASALHDIGKLSIPDEILNKPGRYTPGEFAVMKRHPAAGADMLHNLPFYTDTALVRTAYEICRWHHERYDGSGYPDGLKGEDIPISAQIVAMADVYDALTSERCYKPSYSHEKAISMIVGGECGAFNPLVIDCLLDVQDQIPAALLASESPDQVPSVPLSQERLSVIARLHETPAAAQQAPLPEGNAETGLILTRAQAYSLQEHLRPLFHLVRFVEPDNTAQFTINAAGEMVHDPADCFCLWGRNARCDNCVAMRATACKGHVSRLEFLDDAMYYIDSIYAEIEGKPCALELVSMTRDEAITGQSDRAELIKSISEYNAKIYTDSLTGVNNRRYFDEQLAGLPSVDAVIYLDVNDFKQINDTCGHQTGDLTLCAFSSALSACVRSMDAVVRYGGDEFCVVFREIPQEMFELKFALIRERLSHITLAEHPDLSFSASVGGVYGPGATKELVRIADGRMYEEKIARRKRLQEEQAEQ